jgi:MerR family transcriptional regulator, redox-sensitive transcriptional activator SoxR
MAELTISQVARQVGLRPSAIRYYEELGVLAPPRRVNGRRCYDEIALYRLALILGARATGFTLDEIRRLFFTFPEGVPVSQRWRELGTRKLEELAEQRARIEEMEAALRRLVTCCNCDAVDQCGRAMFRKVTARAGGGREGTARSPRGRPGAASASSAARPSRRR